MKRNKYFKILNEALDKSRLFNICHLLSAPYVCVCQQILHDTELHWTP